VIEETDVAEDCPRAGVETDARGPAVDRCASPQFQVDRRIANKDSPAAQGHDCRVIVGLDHYTEQTDESVWQQDFVRTGIRQPIDHPVSDGSNDPDRDRRSVDYRDVRGPDPLDRVSVVGKPHMPPVDFA
jgi:hypothetical protein